MGQGTLLPATVTVVRGSKEVAAARSLNTHLAKGNKVRLGKWTFVVQDMKDKHKTIVSCALRNGVPPGVAHILSLCLAGAGNCHPVRLQAEAGGQGHLRGPVGA